MKYNFFLLLFLKWNGENGGVEKIKSERVGGEREILGKILIIIKIVVIIKRRIIKDKEKEWESWA